jgi:UDP-glucose 4-epimerase
MTTVLVTGGAGYIGSHAVLALLDAGHRPVVLDDLSAGVREAVPEGATLVVADVGDRERVGGVLAEHGVQAVMHLAGSVVVPESVADPAKYYRNNTMASLSLIEASLEAGIEAFVFSSTAAVYGAVSGPVGEDHPTRPISPYGASKLMIERMLADVAAARPRFRPICLRYFNVAGADPQGRAGQRTPEPTHLISAAVDAALGRRPALEIFGADYPTRDGTCERDYIHVSDLAAVHVIALEHLTSGGEGAVLNCGYGRGVTVREVVERLERLIGRPLPVREAPRRPGDPPSIVADCSKLRALLPWSPAHGGLEDILASALAWRRSLQPAD